MGSIQVANLGKAYKQYPNRWSRLVEWLSPFGGVRHGLHWVLQDLNFTVNAGEAVGIVGMNGAGKSTLLKMITGTTQPTSGSVQVQGRIAALLELGMGFDPDFTGRQNAVMAGQLLGMTADEVKALMPQIQEFAEIGDYIDQPVRVYSSGMQMRLAFSVATVQRPDILIIDEALSVGDNYFQHKSFERIRAYSKLGTTLLIVSHDKGAVQAICDRTILLNAGKIALQGDPEAVMDYYNAMLAERGDVIAQQTLSDDGKTQTVSGTGEARIAAAQLCDEAGRAVEVVKVGQPLELQVTVQALKELPELVLGFQLKDRLGQVIYGTNTFHSHQIVEHVRAGENIHYRFRFYANVGQGSYSISLSLHDSDSHLGKNYEWRDRAIVFTVVNVDKQHFVGMNWLSTEADYTRA